MSLSGIPVIEEMTIMLIHISARIRGTVR